MGGVVPILHNEIQVRNREPQLKLRNFEVCDWIPKNPSRKQLNSDSERILGTEMGKRNQNPTLNQERYKKPISKQESFLRFVTRLKTGSERKRIHDGFRTRKQKVELKSRKKQKPTSKQGGSKMDIIGLGKTRLKRVI